MRTEKVQQVLVSTAKSIPRIMLKKFYVSIMLKKEVFKLL